jgi:hypothetical protein
MWTCRPAGETIAVEYSLIDAVPIEGLETVLAPARAAGISVRDDEGVGVDATSASS